MGKVTSLSVGKWVIVEKKKEKSKGKRSRWVFYFYRISGAR